ncbi:unnamed protein product, partial [marine sediment metagenome]
RGSFFKRKSDSESTISKGLRIVMRIISYSGVIVGILAIWAGAMGLILDIPPSFKYGAVTPHADHFTCIFLIESQNRLGFYTKYFNVIEINTTFYSLPKISTVQNWRDQVPVDFKFTVKVWQEITHKFKDANIEDSISQFFYRLSPLKDKTSAYLLQFPPWFKYSEKHFHQLKYLTRELPNENRYIIELRDNSWFNEKLLPGVIESSTIILGTTYMPGLIQNCY